MQRCQYAQFTTVPLTPLSHQKKFFFASFSLGSWFLQARNAHGTFAERIPQMKINNFKKQKR